MIYLDYVSTTPLSSELRESYDEILKKYFANSESLHDAGREVYNLVEKSRAQIAGLLHVDKNEIIFTSGASESNTTALKGILLKSPKKHLIVSAYEHSSIMEASRQLKEYFGIEVTYLKPNEHGQITPEAVKEALRPDTALVSVMLVNNEIGTINPVKEIAEIVKKESGAYFHVDAVQALGKMDIDLKDVDLASFSMHKIFGLKGSGLLMKKRHVDLLPLINGGQQEFGIRGGTLNSYADILAAKTLRIAMEEQKEHTRTVRKLWDHLYENLKDEENIIINSFQEGSPYIFNFSCLSIPSEVMMNALNQKGFALSAQSTCHSRSKSISHVYQAMGYDQKRAEGAVRLGLSHLVTIEDLDAFLSALKGIMKDYGRL